MKCPTCSSRNPEAAAFCFRCGTALRRADAARMGRGGAYAVQGSENVTQLALISTIMPHTNRKIADNYRWGMIVSGGLILVLTLAGFIPAAILAAAFLVPLTYLIYLYDVNLWEDQPVPVVAGLFLFTGALSAVVSLVFYEWVFDAHLFQLLAVSSRGTGDIATTFPVVSLLIFAVVLPVVSEVAKNAGPLLLATRPLFDDMIDALTFGVAAGTAYAAVETIVAFMDVFTAGQLRTTTGVAGWLPIVLNVMVVKSLIYGTATGIVVASFSGLGRGYDGFTGRYVRNFAFAVLANVLYWVGTWILAYAPFGQALGLVWGLAILALLVLRVRVMLHAALLEAAVADAARTRRSPDSTRDSGFCPECEMPLLPDSLFCIVCGTSVRATSAQARRDIRAPVRAPQKRPARKTRARARGGAA